jgi:hypothetical protein
MSVYHQGFADWYSSEADRHYDSREAAEHYDAQAKTQRVSSQNAAPLIMGMGGYTDAPLAREANARPINSLDDLPSEMVLQLANQLRDQAMDAEGAAQHDENIRLVLEKHTDYEDDPAKGGQQNADRVRGWLLANTSGKLKYPNYQLIDDAIIALKERGELTLKPTAGDPRKVWDEEAAWDSERAERGF